jgi:hypothetical protein
LISATPINKEDPTSRDPTCGESSDARPELLKVKNFFFLVHVFSYDWLARLLVHQVSIWSENQEEKVSLTVCVFFRANQESGVVWNDDTLFDYLENPKR